VNATATIAGRRGIWRQSRSCKAICGVQDVVLIDVEPTIPDNLHEPAGGRQEVAEDLFFGGHFSQLRIFLRERLDNCVFLYA